MQAPEEADHLAFLHNVSELTSLVTHEFNNILNGILLHIAVIKQEAPPELVAELDVIRTLGNNASALIKKLQQYNSKRRVAPGPVDVNAVVREIVSQRRSSIPIQTELAANLPRAQAKEPELRRLLNLLLDEAETVLGSSGGTITLRTGQDGKRLVLRVEDSGPSIPQDQLPRIFEPFHMVRPGRDEANLSIGHTLARHLQGSLRAENLPQGGVAMVVELSPARE